MSPLKEIYGPAALVTGASSGIGASYARLLAAQGFDLVLVARRIDRLRTLRSRLSKDHGINVAIVSADIGAEGGTTQICATAEEFEVGLLVNNAGCRIRKPFVELERTELDEMVMVNALGHARLTRQLLPRLLQRSRSGILFTGSIEATMGFPNSAVYAASKAFIRSLGEGLFGELQHQGIDVLVLEPGSTDTENLARQVDGNVAAAVSPESVAQFGLSHIDEGPVLLVGNSDERDAVQGLAAMPRADALRLLGNPVEGNP